MQDLHANAAPFSMNSVRDQAMTGDLGAPRELPGKRCDPAGYVWRDAARDHQADSTARPLREVGGEPGIVPRTILEPRVHGAHEHAVLQGDEAEVERLGLALREMHEEVTS